MRTRAPITAALGTAALLALGACGGDGEQKSEFLDRWHQEGPHAISSERAYEAAQAMCEGLSEGEGVKSVVLDETLKFMGTRNGETKAEDMGMAMGLAVLVMCPEHEDQVREAAGLMGAE